LLTPSLKKLTPLQLFICFSKIGLSGFGGVLPWARRGLVEKDKLLTSEEFSAILGVCQIMPGPNVINVGVCVGSRFCGAKGAFAAVAGLTTGPIFIVILLAILYDHFSYLEYVQGALKCIAAVGVGLIASTGLKMLKDELRYPPMLLVIALTMLTGIYFDLALGWVVLIVAPSAYFFATRKAKKL
jgi:chromate transporter